MRRLRLPTMPDGLTPGVVMRGLAQDIGWGLHHLVVNTIAGGVLTPRILRVAIYRLMGISASTTGIYSGCTIVGSGPLTIGERTFINRCCYFEAAGPISIGASTAVGMQALFVTSTHAFEADGRFNEAPTPRPVRVGNRCWIGARATILPGVTIGDDVVIASNAVVTSDCAPGGLYAGVPARRIRELPRGPRSATALADRVKDVDAYVCREGESA